MRDESAHRGCCEEVHEAQPAGLPASRAQASCLVVHYTMLKLNVNFVFGRTVPFAEMPNNSIALDGACQAPQLDPSARKFSFDHHAGCLRFATLATCQQVALALRMGLVVDEQTEVFCNDWDADTVLAIWLLTHTERVSEPKVVELVEKIGLMDAHFLGPIHPVHYMLSPPRGSVQTAEMLDGFLATLDAWYEGTLEYPAPRKQTGMALAWEPENGWQDIGEISDGFNSIYAAGYLAGIIYTEAPGGTLTYTVGRRSDFVPVPVGPSHIDRANDPASYRSDTLLGKLAQAEIAMNPSQPHSTNWGGSTTVGGSCRNEGNVASVLKPLAVLEICCQL